MAILTGGQSSARICGLVADIGDSEAIRDQGGIKRRPIAARDGALGDRVTQGQDPERGWRFWHKRTLSLLQGSMMSIATSVAV